MKQAVIVSAARTGLAKSFRGSFNITHGATMGGHAVRAAVERAGIEGGEIEDAIIGCGFPEAATGHNIARQIAISRRRSERLARIIATMPRSAVTTTMPDTPVSARSATPTICQSSCRATPGRIASKGSSRYSLIQRCRPKICSRDCVPIRAAVIAFGVRSIWRMASTGVVCPGTRAPERQSTWIASIASRLTITVRSTGVPLRARMPATRKGWSS